MNRVSIAASVLTAWIEGSTLQPVAAEHFEADDVVAAERRLGSAEIPAACAGAGRAPSDTAGGVIAAIFSAIPVPCDLNGDGVVSAADLTSAVHDAPDPSATPSPSRLPAASPTPTASPGVRPTPAISFTDVTGSAGLDYSPFDSLSGGVAAGDYDRDGDVDLYLVRVDGGGNPLFRNRGDGTFEEVGQSAGATLPAFLGSSPLFGDADGDGWLDLFVQGVVGTGTRLLRNRGDGTFADVSAVARIAEDYETHQPFCNGCDSPGGAAWGDYDRDGDLDLFITHLETAVMPVRNLWRNDGDGTFIDVTERAGVEGIVVDRGKGLSSYMYSPNFADIDNDGWLDLLVVSDWGMSRVFTNDRDGTFTDRTNAVITDEAGMGSAVGDYDKDGNLDWFVTSIWDPTTHRKGVWTGNRLYRGLGDGTFEDTTAHAGVGVGWWGWGACFADFDNDGHLDIFHVNGADEEPFTDDPSRLFLSNGDGTFSERSRELAIEDRRLGFGIVCFDYDDDGDIDIFVQSRFQPSRLYRNDGGNQHNHLTVSLRGRAPNSEAIGARVSVTVQGQTQIHEVRSGNNFMSQNPAVAHFGLRNAAAVDAVEVRWPDQDVTVYGPAGANQHLVIEEP